MKKVISYLLFSVLLVSCGTTRKLVNSTENPIPNGIDLNKIPGVIKLAGAKKGWVIVEKGTNELEGNLKVRSHSVKVKIPFTKSKYDIIYKDSFNMKYDSSSNVIHRNYLRWVNNLKQQIDMALLGATIK